MPKNDKRKMTPTGPNLQSNKDSLKRYKDGSAFCLNPFILIESEAPYSIRKTPKTSEPGNLT